MRNLFLATTCACLLGVLTAACGGPSPQSAPPSRSASGDALGGPRLAWDQFASNAEELRRYSFVLYVDGTSVPLPDAACGTLPPETLQAACTSSLPALTTGQHTLEMATRVTESGVVMESARSAPIVYTAGAPSVSWQAAGARAQTPERADAAPLAYIVDRVVSGVDRPSALARLPDGRLLIAERGGRIRVAENGILLPDPAAELAGADPGLDARVSLAVASDFALSHQVYVSYATLDDSGSRAGRVVRFREAGGKLGEAVALIDGLPADSAAPVVRVGRDGALYVGMSALDEHEAGDLGSRAGKILRLNRDGTTPADNPFTSSPVFAFGYRDWLDFDWDPAGGTLWHVDADAVGAALGRAIRGAERRPVATLGTWPAAGMTFYAGDALAEWRGSLFVASPDERCLLRVSGLSASPAQPAVERVLTGFGRLATVLSTADGLYFATANGVDAGGQPADAVYRVGDNSSRAAAGRRTVR